LKVLLRDAEKLICVAIFGLMTLVGFANVVVRYLTDYSLAATEEILTNGFLLLTIFGAAVAARRGEHLAVSVLFDLAPVPVRKVVLVISFGLSAVLLALSAWYCFELVVHQHSSGTRSYALQVPAWYYSVGLPLGFALTLIRYLQRAVGEYSRLSRGSSHA